jgi:hypothetical protein
MNTPPTPQWINAKITPPPTDGTDIVVYWSYSHLQKGYCLCTIDIYSTGGHIFVNPHGVTGYEWEPEFQLEHILFWMPLTNALPPIPTTES